MRTKLIGQLVEQALANIRVGHFPAAEEDGEFHLMAGIEKFRGLPPLRLQIVVINLWPDAHFFQLNDVLMAARLALLPALLVTELAVVHQTTDGRHGVWRNFDQIKPALTRHLQRIERGNDANLLAVLVDEPDLANPDTLVDASLNGSGNNLPPLV